MNSGPSLNNVSSEVATVLVEVARLMSEAREDWCLIGGAAVALYGMTAPLRDIDLVLSAADAHAVFARLGVEATADGGTERFRSEVFCRWHGLGMQVDFMAGFEVHAHGAWVPVPPRPATRMAAGPHWLWLPSREDLIAMFALFDRPHDHERIAYLTALPA